MKSCQVECLDVDHTLYPQTRRASKLDHVSIVAVNGLDGTQRAHAAFILELCALSNPSTVYLLSRVRFAGEPDKRQIRLGCGDLIKDLRNSSDSEFVSFRADDQSSLVNFLVKYWRCYGGSWIIAADCHDEDAFLAFCRDAEDRQITVSEARDRLVLSSRTAAVSFDDCILDLITQVCHADELRGLVLRVATNHKVDVTMCPSRQT